MSEIKEIFFHYLIFYKSSIIASFLAVCIIEYIFKNTIESIVKRKTKNSKKHIFFLKDYVYIIFQIVAAIILMRLVPIHKDIALKVVDKIKYYESIASDLFIYLAEVGLLYSVVFKIIIKRIKGKKKNE